MKYNKRRWCSNQIKPGGPNLPRRGPVSPGLLEFFPPPPPPPPL